MCLGIEVQARTVPGIGAIEQVSAERSVLVAEVIGEPWVNLQNWERLGVRRAGQVSRGEHHDWLFDVGTNTAMAPDSRLVTEANFTVIADRVASVGDRDVR